VAYVPQATQLNLPYRVRDVVAMGRVASSGWFGPRHVSDRAAIDRALVQMGLADLGDRTFTSLSGGERQLVVAARALATECGILVLDEPMAALDLKRQAHTLGVLQRLAARGTGIVFSTHQPDHALHVASSVLGLGPDANTLYGPTRDVCTEANLTRIYGVDVRLIDVQSTRGPVTGAIPLIHPALASSEL
jgi:iron complex transport system ATP-binding protein